MLLRQLVPDFYVYLVRLCDGGHLLPRAKLTLNLAGAVPDAKYVSALGALLRRDFTLDLFGVPPQRERIRAEAVVKAAQGLDQRLHCAAVVREGDPNSGTKGPGVGAPDAGPGSIHTLSARAAATGRLREVAPPPESQVPL